jgi:hypothetical protein
MLPLEVQLAGLGTVPAFGTFHPMDAAQKLKIALDETRMLILGAQVLLGFQMSSVFQDAFEQIPTSSKQWDAVALLMMVAVVGFLIAPAAHHRITMRAAPAAASTRSLASRCPAPGCCSRWRSASTFT